MLLFCLVNGNKGTTVSSINMSGTVSNVKGRKRANGKQWNSSSQPSIITKKENHTNKNVLNLLRSHHQKTASSSVQTPAHKTLSNSVACMVGQMNNEDTGNLLWSIDINNVKSEEELVEIIEAKYVELLETLENDLKQHLDESHLLEEDLASRYDALENIADRIDDDQYQKIFDKLEKERIQLENDTVHRKQHYKLRLQSIQLQKQEIFDRLRAKLSTISPVVNSADTGKGNI